MGTLYIDTGGSATNSGSRDENAALLTGAAATVSGVVVSLDGSPDLSTIVYTPGSTQDSIYLDQATNAYQKIFWIEGVDDVAKTVTVATAPTGIVSSTWAIGGRCVLTNAGQEGALRAGDTAIFNNSPAPAATSIWAFRNSGSAADGYATIRGKTGVRPIFTTTASTDCIYGNSKTHLKVENLEVVQQGAGGSGIRGLSSFSVIRNVKVSDSGTLGGIVLVYAVALIDCEVSGSNGPGVAGGNGGWVIGCYIHDNATGGVRFEASPYQLDAHVISSIIDTNNGYGIRISQYITGSYLQYILGNTIYGNSGGGIYLDDNYKPAIIANNILKDNGGAGKYNLSTQGYYALTSEYNIFDISGGVGGTNFNNFTPDATDIIADPLFTDAAAGDFTLLSTSPAKAAGYPGVFLGGPTGYLDIGAVQRQEPTGGGAFSYGFFG